MQLGRILCAIQGLVRALPSDEGGRVIILENGMKDEFMSVFIHEEIVEHEKGPEGRVCHLATQTVICNGVREYNDHRHQAKEEGQCKEGPDRDRKVTEGHTLLERVCSVNHLGKYG